MKTKSGVAASEGKMRVSIWEANEANMTQFTASFTSACKSGRLLWTLTLHLLNFSIRCSVTSLKNKEVKHRYEMRK